MMNNIKVIIITGLCAFILVGCTKPEPQVIDMDEVAAEAGLLKDDYTVHENGAMEIHSKVEADMTVDSVITAFKDAGLPIGKVIIQTAETDPNEKLGRPGEYIGSAQFEDTRVEQLQPMPELKTAEPDLPLGGVIEVFENQQDLQSRKKHIEQAYEMMPMMKQYVYVNDFGLLRLEYALTPKQAKEYETVFMSL